MLLDSPAKFEYSRRNPQPRKDAFDLGTAVHTKVLGTGAQIITYPAEHLTPAGKVSEKAATVAWADGKRANGYVVIAPSQAAQVDGMAESILAHPTGRALFEQDGNAEASVFATDPGSGVRMRGRFDFLPNLDTANPIAVDLKTTSKKADKAGFERSVVDYGYETQEAWYDEAFQIVTGQQIPFVFVVVEVAAPHLVAVHQLDVQFRQMGRDKAKRARDLYAACTESGVWPGYPAEVQLISPPTWAVFQHAERFE